MKERKLGTSKLLLLTGNTGLFVRLTYVMVVLFLIGNSCENHVLLGITLAISIMGVLFGQSFLPEIILAQGKQYWEKEDYRSLRVLTHQMLRQNLIMGGIFTIFIWIFAKDLAAWLLPDVLLFDWILRCASLMSFMMSFVYEYRAIYTSIGETKIVTMEELASGIFYAFMVVLLPFFIKENEAMLVCSIVITVLLGKVVSFCFYQYLNHTHHDFFHEEAFHQKTPAVEAHTILNQTRVKWIVGILLSIVSQCFFFVSMYSLFHGEQITTNLNEMTLMTGYNLYDIWIYICILLGVGILFSKNILSKKENRETILQQRILKYCYYGLPIALSITFLAGPFSTILYGSEVMSTTLFYGGIFGIVFGAHVFMINVLNQYKLHLELATYQVIALILTMLSNTILMNMVGSYSVYISVFFGEGAFIYLCCAKLQNKMEIFSKMLGIYVLRIFLSVCAMNGVYALSKWFVFPQFQENLWFYGFMTLFSILCGMMVYIFVSHLMGITKSMGDKEK